MKQVILFLSTFLFSIFLNAQQQKWSRVKIFTGETGLIKLAKAGIAVDHGVIKKGSSFTGDLSNEELEKVKQLGLRYDVLIDDVQQHYIHQNDPQQLAAQSAVSQSPNCLPRYSFSTPTNFTLGSMGGFFTYSEILAHLDTMANLYPNLVHPRTAIDSTLLTDEGRYVYWIKLSDNPNNDEAEPEMLYSAAHHAREPGGVSQLIFYMYYLLENYATNPEIQYLLDNTELYFVPCLNPDGYVYNETTNPQGGGMWRKNRHDNGDGTYGVDLNRNYDYNWGFDNIGSSPVTYDATYRGTSGFSEAETQLMRQFCNAHQFRIALNYHNYSNLLIYPWGYLPQAYTPDSALFASWGSFLTVENQYVFGTGDQTVGYVTNGDADDWMYGEQTNKPKILSMTPEAGDQLDGFWPAQNRIEDICKINIPMDLNAARLLLAYGKVSDQSDRYLRQTSGQLYFDFQCLGLDTTPTFTVSITPLSSWITSTGSPRNYSGVTLLQTIRDSIAYTLNPVTPEGTFIDYVITVNNGTFATHDTITKIVGTPVVLLANNGSSTTGWYSNGSWGTTTAQFWSSPSSITDSPNGFYYSYDYTDLITATPVDLSNALSAQLSFYTRFELETGYDYTQAAVSIDAGVTWTPLCGRYTVSNNSLDFGNPVWTGFKNQWIKEEMSLDNYIGQQVLIRFLLASDSDNEYDGFYIDDLIVETIDTSSVSGLDENSLLQISQNTPNPADNYAYINIGNLPDNGELYIYNSLGQLIKQIPVSSNNHLLYVNTESLAPGIYYYRLQVNELISTTQRMQIIR